MGGNRRGRFGLYRIGAFAAAGVVAASLVSTGLSGAASSSPKTATPHAVNGGTAIWAEASSAVPNFIFPFMPINFFSITNISQFQYMMFRPLYWFGTGTKPTLNTSLSLANSPAYSKNNTVVTINLKSYKWANGEKVTATDVLFWMNLLKTDKAGWAAYAAGTIPDDVASIKVDSPTQLTMTLTGSVNPYWYTYNELSQITPLPLAWDVTAAGAKAGSGGCSAASFTAITINAKTSKPTSAAATACNAVYTFLSEQSGYNPANPKAANNSLATYATNPLWQVVDGPWHLKSFSASGQLTLIPNPSYSGPVKPKLSAFEELPYTSDTSEFNALVGGKVTYGYIPVNDLPATTNNPTKPAANNARIASKFALNPVYEWGINYFPYNFHSTGDGGQAGKIFSQLYFRQAFQTLVDQTLYAKKIFKGYAVPTYGPVPVEPQNPFTSSSEKSNPYPFNTQKAVNLLTSHGWKVVPGGTTTCSVAAKCGVPAGTPLAFTIQYASGNTFQAQEMQAEQSSWAAAGIKITLTPAAFDTVIGNATPCSGASCTWQMDDWGGGWLYAPDFYPTGELLFQTGAGSNVGSYSDPHNDALIKATDFTTASLANWENYLAQQLPFVWQPNEAYALYEIQKNLAGATPVNPLLALTPENWYFTK